MLSDIERKVLRILYNLYQQNWIRPDLARVSQFSQRSEQRVRAAVKGLIAAGYIEIKENRMRILIPGEPELLKTPERKRLPDPQDTRLNTWGESYVSQGPWPIHFPN